LKGPGDEWDQPYWQGSGLDAQAGVKESWGGDDMTGYLSLSVGGLNASTNTGAALKALAPINTTAEGPITYRFDLLPTPSKRRDTRHFDWRYMNGRGCDYSGPGPGGNVQANCTGSELNTSWLGVNVVQIHHGTFVNPYIDYPLDPDADAALEKFTAWNHAHGKRVVLYFTTRELSSHAAELFALRSLGDEIVSMSVTTPPGDWFLQEHLRANYSMGWTTYDPNVGQQEGVNIIDAAVQDHGTSRWSNFYVNGVGFLACAKMIDGIELDGIAYGRHTMVRARKVLDNCFPTTGGLINLHLGDSFGETRCSVRCAF
jgi:hypothetical protein